MKAFTSIGLRCAAALLGALPFAATGAEGYASWDNFDGATRIDPARWIEGDERIGVEGGKLRIVKRARGSQSGNNGVFHDLVAVDLVPRTAITRMQAKVTVGAVEVTGCAANPVPSRAIGGLAGQYFNAGAAAPKSAYDDVGAFLAVGMASDAPGVIQVVGGIYQCKADCEEAAVDLGTVPLGTAAPGETLTLTLDWDAAHHRFGFTRAGLPTTWVVYAVSDARPAFEPSRALTHDLSLANCLGGPRTEGLVDLKFDNVKVNASALP